MFLAATQRVTKEVDFFLIDEIDEKNCEEGLLLRTSDGPAPHAPQEVKCLGCWVPHRDDLYLEPSSNSDSIVMCNSGFKMTSSRIGQVNPTLTVLNKIEI
jgi:hypothetical protein